MAEATIPENQPKSIAIWIGVWFYLIPALLNQWTIKYFFADYIGKGLSASIIALLWLFAGCSIGLGSCIIKFGFGRLREIWVFIIMSLPSIITAAYLSFTAGQPANMAELFYCQMLCILTYMILTLMFFRWGIVIGFILVILTSSFELMYALMYKTVISPSAFYNIFETNPQEAIGYLNSYLFNFSSLLFIVIFGFACLMLFKITARVNRKRMSIYLVGVSIFLVLPLAFPKVHERVLPHNLLFKLAKGYSEYKLLYMQVDGFSNKSLDEIEAVSFLQPQAESELHVFIIGESADRDHMGCYGYHRNNTPMMEGMSKELFLFSDVISIHNNTIPNMKKMMTLANYESDESFFEKGSLIHYLRKGGYETHWISNQNPIGKYDTMTTVLAKACDSVYFVNRTESFIEHSSDEKILPIFEEVLSRNTSRSQFVFIHLMGSHSPFKLRYPHEYDRFNGNIDGKTKNQSEIINDYDNSILYSDYIVSQIIQIAKDTNRYASVLYISDHGLEVYENGSYCGHSLYEGLEIPFVLWVSDEYKKSNARKVESFSGYIERKYSSDDIFFSICDLLNMRFESFRANRSIFSDSFRANTRYVGMPNKATMWDYDSAPERADNESKIVFEEQSDEFKDKVWAHKINDTDKLVSAAEIFHGMELDVVFDFGKKIFDVRHPPGKTNNLSLDGYWDQLDDLSRFKFWIDFKNMSAENRTASLERLLYLSDKHDIPRENIMIESREPFPLKDFKAKGFMTSYWISVAFLQNESEKALEEIGKHTQKSLMKIKKEIDDYRIDAISFPIDSLDLVNKFLPEVDAINVWAPKLFFNREQDLEEVERILEANARINALLVEYY
jgi:heptose-I-phosphate ethanolaminephosphotransferase